MDVRRKEHREGSLDDFIKLIYEETMLVNDPLFSKETVDQYTGNKSGKQDNSKKRISTLATNSDKEEKKDVQTRDPLCIACNEDHLLDSCKIFMEKTLQERTKLLANKKLCYGCYQPMTISLLHSFIQQSLNSGFAQVQILLMACRRFEMVRSLTMVPAGNKVKRFSSVNHTTKTIRHHHHHHQ